METTTENWQKNP